MRAASQAMQFEKAAMYRDRLRAVREVMQKQKAVSVRGDDYDVLACASDGEDALVQALFMRAGKLIGSETFVMERGDGEAPRVGCWRSSCFSTTTRTIRYRR